jgi:hypothetical protein
VVAAEDRPFAGFVRSIQGAVVERIPGIPTRAVGQKNVPGVAQAHVLEEATILIAETVETAVHEVMEARIATPAAAADAAAAHQPAIGVGAEQPPVRLAPSEDWLWIPRRYDNG